MTAASAQISKGPVIKGQGDEFHFSQKEKVEALSRIVRLLAEKERELSRKLDRVSIKVAQLALLLSEHSHSVNDNSLKVSKLSAIAENHFRKAA
jgi:hypothetical protein